jgi:hypothetical protein
LTVAVAGQSIRNASGNTFEIDEVSGSGDPWLFAMRLFRSTDDATRLEGYGVSNDDGLVSSTNTKPLIYSNFSLGGQGTDLLFVTSYTTASSTSTARVLTGVQPPVIGLAQRPSNPTCLAPQGGVIPNQLADTGCFDMATRKPVAGVIPYDVAHPFWSDGVIKERYLALPDNTSIWVDSAGNWQLPVGGMMIKNFYYNTVLFETRFVAQLATGPIAYTYKWNSGASATRADATPTTASLTGDPHLGARTWAFPSNVECKTCHNEGKNDFFLGLNTEQFNTEVEYESTGLRADQMRTLQALGVIAGPGHCRAVCAPSTIATDVLGDQPRSSRRAAISARAASAIMKTSVSVPGGR